MTDPGDRNEERLSLGTNSREINHAVGREQMVLTHAVPRSEKKAAVFLLKKDAPEDIFTAAIAGHTNIVAALLKQDPKRVNLRDYGGKAALHWAALNGQNDMVQFLIAQKAEVNGLDAEGFTALHWAAMFDKSDGAPVLLANGADYNLKDPKFEWTPLRLAVIHGHLATADVLLKSGSNPNLRDELELPLLLKAVLSGNQGMVALLLARQADANAKDSAGETALEEALAGGNQEIIGLLRRNGAQEPMRAASEN